MTKKKKSPDRDGHYIGIRLDDETYDALEEEIEAAKESLSVVVRGFIRDGLKAKGRLR